MTTKPTLNKTSPAGDSDRSGLVPAPVATSHDRTTYIGGHDIGAIIGIHPFVTEYQVWAAKTLGIRDAATPAMEAGLRLEDTIIDWWCEREDWVVHARGVDVANRRHPDWERAGGSPDALIARAGDDSPTAGMDAKATSGHGWLTYTVPEYVEVQAQWYMEICDIDEWWIAALVGSTDLRSYCITRDRVFGADLLAAGRAWWERHVDGNLAPRPTSRDVDILRRTPANVGATVELTSELATKFHEYVALKDVEKVTTARLKDLAADLQAFMGDATELTYEGVSVASWRPTPTNTIDQAALKAAGLRDQFASKGITRTFRIVR